MKQTIRQVQWSWVLIGTLLVLGGVTSAWAQSNTFPSSGDVGIGTTSPSHKLHVRGSGGTATVVEDTTDDVAFVLRSGRSAAGAQLGNVGFGGKDAGLNATVYGQIVSILGSPTEGAETGILAFKTMRSGTLTEALRIDGAGSIGIGTTSPAQRLHIEGGRLQIVPTAEPYAIAIGRTDTSKLLYIGATPETQPSLVFSNNAGSELLRITSDGYMGIGTSSPGGRLHVDGGALFSALSTGTGLDVRTTQSASAGTQGRDSPILVLTGAAWDGAASRLRGFLFQTVVADATTYRFSIQRSTDGAERLVVTDDGNVGIGTTAPDYKLHVVGDATFSGTVTGGNIAAKYQDVAEWVPAAGSPSPGTVMVIDALEGNRVLPASRPYDTRVAGVVTSQPGLLLGEAGENKAKVAHSGRVKVKADARYGSIAVGDLVVTSPTPGHAMRSTPVDLGGASIHRPGTLLGKALEPLKEGQGEILVLLTLQ